ncbi:hypothetical protein [Chelatococcus asaccharovorans]|uniref:hypothetical protein n=1 Tax=Chelatococcus asaccharovorans TaxID=28210 RepID=UPI00224C792B|nr:hypothetical protein [Chelatococcus asaccharovorans]CAH1672845.1 hypothetical protein CHELA17_61440 [Chelatococcus asaccharovorans]CAH1675738.1 hypothetical protein CHELA40_14181 [Chelatococcus asaccharovorans]
MAFSQTADGGGTTGAGAPFNRLVNQGKHSVWPKTLLMVNHGFAMAAILILRLREPSADMQ